MKKILFIILIALTVVSCKKRKTENNLDGAWTVTSFTEGNDEYISATTTLDIEFSEINKGEGKVLLKWTEDGDLFTYPGTFTLNDDYTEIEVTTATNNPDQTQLWNGDLIASETALSIIGTERLVDQAETEQFGLLAIPK